MLHFQEVLSLYNRAFWCESTAATTYLGKRGSLIWSKIYIGVYNYFHNIFRLFDILPNFPFTTSETIRDY